MLGLQVHAQRKGNTQPRLFPTLRTWTAGRYERCYLDDCSLGTEITVLAANGQQRIVVDYAIYLTPQGAIEMYECAAIDDEACFLDRNGFKLGFCSPSRASRTFLYRQISNGTKSGWIRSFRRPQFGPNIRLEDDEFENRGRAVRRRQLAAEGLRSGLTFNAVAPS